MAQVLADQGFVHRQIQLGAGRQHGGKILPTAGRDKLRSVHIVLDAVKMLGAQFQVSLHSGVQAVGAGILLPDGKVRLNINAAYTVQCDKVKIPHALVVLRRIAGGNNHPAGGHSLVAKGFALQKLQHGGSQCFGYTVDLVNKQNTVFQAGLLHLVIHAGNDLAHCVLRYAAVRAAKIAVADKWQAHGALAGVVGDGVCHQRNAAFLRDLLHDLGFANARRAHQQNRPLADGRNQRGAGIVHGKVCLDRVFNFLFGAFDVHGGYTPSSKH